MTAITWLHADRAITVRYEDLHPCPLVALTRVTEQIKPVERERIEAADRGVPRREYAAEEIAEEGPECPGGESR